MKTPCRNGVVKQVIIADNMPVFNTRGTQIGFAINLGAGFKWKICLVEPEPAGAINKKVHPKIDGAKTVGFTLEYVMP